MDAEEAPPLIVLTGPDLRRYREAQGRSREWVAAMCGMSTRSLAYYESGQIPVETLRLRTLIPLARILQIPLDKIIVFAHNEDRTNEGGAEIGTE